VRLYAEFVDFVAVEHGLSARGAAPLSVSVLRGATRSCLRPCITTSARPEVGPRGEDISSSSSTPTQPRAGFDFTIRRETA
jgi:hypothetical protein